MRLSGSQATPQVRSNVARLAAKQDGLLVLSNRFTGCPGLVH
nr:MAG TPA: hypothetical protein [Caudoviricetes sp.]